VVTLFPVGVFYLSHNIGRYKGQKLVAWARRLDRSHESQPRQGLDRPAQRRSVGN